MIEGMVTHFWLFLKVGFWYLVSVSRARGRGRRRRGGGRGRRGRSRDGRRSGVVGGGAVRAAGSAGAWVVRAVCQAVAGRGGRRFPNAGVRSTGRRAFPGRGWAVAGGGFGGGRNRSSVLSGRHHWHHRHHGHSEAGLLDQLGDQEAQDQGDGQLGQDKRLHCLQTDQGDEDRHQGLHLELQQQQHWKQEFLLQ